MAGRNHFELFVSPLASSFLLNRGPSFSFFSILPKRLEVVYVRPWGRLASFSIFEHTHTPIIERGVVGVVGEPVLF